MNITRNPRPRPRSAAPSLNPRQSILAQWRGVDLAPVEQAKALTAQAIKAVMPKVLSELGLERRCGETEIIKVWNHLLDPNIIAHAQPAGLHKGTLFVNVDNSVWLSELVRYRRREILERLQHSFGKALITRISFRIG
jgi:predicted nucleic acid-binding Zn ribbon protein